MANGCPFGWQPRTKFHCLSYIHDDDRDDDDDDDDDDYDHPFCRKEKRKKDGVYTISFTVLNGADHE